MDKGSHVFLQDIDLKSNNINNTGLISNGDNSISLLNDSTILSSPGNVVIKSDNSEVVNISKNEESETLTTKIDTDVLNITAKTSLKSGEKSEIKVDSDNGISITSDKVSIKDEVTNPKLQILADNGTGDSFIKSDISESGLAKAGSFLIGNKYSLEVDSNGSLVFIREGV